MTDDEGRVSGGREVAGEYAQEEAESRMEGGERREPRVRQTELEGNRTMPIATGGSFRISHSRGLVVAYLCALLP